LVSDLPRFGMARLAKILPCGRFRDQDAGRTTDSPNTSRTSSPGSCTAASRRRPSVPGSRSFL